MRLKKIITAFVAFVMLVSCFPCAIFAQEAPIKLYIDNVEQRLNNPCVIDEGTVYIPMQEVFFKMGVYMEWNEKEELWYGEGNNGEIRITVGSNVADIDWVDVELPAPVKEINGVVMIPLYLVEDALKTDAPIYDEETKSIYIKFPDINDKPKQKFRIESVVNDLPEPKQDLFREEQLYNLRYDNGGTTMQDYKVVDVEGMPFKKAAQIEMKKFEDFPKSIYSVQMDTMIDEGSFEAGDVGLATFWARATTITDESGVAKMRFCYESLGDWQKVIQGETVSIGYEWKQYYLPMYNARYTMQGGNAHLCFSVGGKHQIIQVADVHLYNYGKDVSIETLIPGAGGAYKGMEDDALWRKEAYRRIEKYRKNDMVITVTDEDGNPVEGAAVKADMTDNEFYRAIAICDSEILDLDTDIKSGRIQSEVMDKYFNAGVSGNEMKEMRLRDDYRTGVREINEYLSRGMQARGHALSWDNLGIRTYSVVNGISNDLVTYDDLRNGTYSYDEIHDYMMDYVRAKVWLFKGTLFQWDGLNEPHDSNGVRNIYGNTALFSDVFQIAKALDPKCKLYVNETGMEGHENRDAQFRATALVDIVGKMKENERAPVDGIGVQGHCVSYLYPQGFYRELQMLAEAVDEVSVTEYDFMNADFTYAPQHLRDTFLATYSLPKSKCFVIWGYWDPMHWRGYGPFYTSDWKAKPELAEWDRIVNEEFVTHETAVTDKDGKAVIRGYRGKYDISVEKDGITGKCEFTLTDSDNTERDNWIRAEIKDGKINLTNPNPLESYSGNNSEGKVRFNSWTEAHADYIAKFGNSEPIGIYKHSDNTGNTVPKTNDGLYNTYWYGGDNSYVTYELVKKAEQGNVSVDFRAPNGEVYNYRVLSSKDGENWDTLYEGNSNEKKTIDFENAMFIRIQSVGNEYMGISEVNINAKNN